MKAPLGSKFDVRSFEAKDRVFEFNDQQMNMFEFVQCSKNDVRVHSIKWCSTTLQSMSTLQALEVGTNMTSVQCLV